MSPEFGSRKARHGGHRAVGAAVLLLLTSAYVSAADTSAFEVGHAAYEAGKFAEASTAFSQAPTSAEALHNLGNAEYRLGHLGPAILAWERARALNPGYRDTVANLRFARGQAGLEQPEASWYENYSAFMTPNRWIVIAMLSFWAAVALLVLPHLLRVRRTLWTQAAAVAAIVTFLLTLPALVGIIARNRIGIVMAANTALRLTPTKEGEVLGSLPEGELARVEKKRGDYWYIRASSDRAGWVSHQEFMRLWQ
jgi:tetratricopeptide (TPR) repeat protein